MLHSGKDLKKGDIFTSINLGYSADTNGLSDVDVSGHGSQPGVVPIFIIRGQLLGDVSLDNVNPFGQLDLAGPRIRLKHLLSKF